MRNLRSPLVRTALAVFAFVALSACNNQRGPDPTVASVEAVTGTFATATIPVPASSVTTFGGGTVYHPTNTSEGTFGVVAIGPGWTAFQSSVSWYGPRLASHGFVVITIDNLDRMTDGPSKRGDQLLAALDHVATMPALVGVADNTRQAAMGWSMGGGGALWAAQGRPALRATVGLAPWDGIKDWSGLTVPTLIVACEADTIAPVANHSEQFYDSIIDPAGAPGEAAFVEIAGANHYCVSTSNNNATQRTAIARSTISFLKRFVDGDTRYNQFQCPPPVSATISETRSTCPF